MCEECKNRKSEYRRYSGLHKHHIIPSHSGGLDVDRNYTYLTAREHIIAHFLLWKMYGNVNDLRSMNMLGAELSVEYRRKIGLFCKENKIGFHKFTREELAEFGKIGGEISRNNKLGYHGLSPEERKKNAINAAKLGGKATLEMQVGLFGLSKEEKLKNCSLGGKISGGWNKGMKCWTKDNVTVIAKECPGDGWINEVIMSQKQKDYNEYIKEFHEVRVICNLTGKHTKLLIPKTEDINHVILNTTNISIIRKKFNMSKHNIIINVPTDTIDKFVAAGWKIHLNDTKDIPIRNKDSTLMYFGDYRTRMPIHLIDILEREGWSKTSNTSTKKYENFEANGYKLSDKNCKDINAYVSCGWKHIDYKTANQITTDDVGSGIKMIFSKTGAVIRIAFKDVRKMEESYGLEIYTKNQKDLRKINRIIESLSESDGN